MLLTAPGTVPDYLPGPGMFGGILYGQPACVLWMLNGDSVTDEHTILNITGDVLLK